MLDHWNGNRDIGGYNDFGPRDPVPRDVLARGPLRNERNGTLIVERIADGMPVGTVGWRLVTVYGPSPMSDAMQIGIELIPEARGQGLGVDAQRLIADYLFATHPCVTRRGVDRQQQRAGTARPREGRLRARGRDARRPVPRRRVPRPRLSTRGSAPTPELAHRQHEERVEIDIRPLGRAHVRHLDRPRRRT